MDQDNTEYLNIINKKINDNKEYLASEFEIEIEIKDEDIDLLFNEPHVKKKAPASYDPETKKIKFYEKITEEELRGALIHEMIHAWQDNTFREIVWQYKHYGNSHDLCLIMMEGFATWVQWKSYEYFGENRLYENLKRGAKMQDVKLKILFKPIDKKDEPTPHAIGFKIFKELKEKISINNNMEMKDKFINNCKLPNVLGKAQTFCKKYPCLDRNCWEWIKDRCKNGK